MTSTMGLHRQPAAQDGVDYAGYLQHRSHERQPMRNDPNASFTSTKGLLNGPGQNNCFLNSAVQAQLLQNRVQICGASIITNQWLVSAAHCFTESSPKWTIITGSSQVSKGGEHHEIKKMILHPNYDGDTADNDIALIQLEKPIKFNEFQNPIPLGTFVPKPGDKMTISGFGKLGEGKSYAKVLQVASVPVLDHQKCKEHYIMDTVTDNMFCAGEGDTDSCQGDSGGPGVINGELVGVVSSGMKCGSKYYPGLYTVVHNYRDWIHKHVGKINNVETTTKKNVEVTTKKSRRFTIPVISDILDVVLHRDRT